MNATYTTAKNISCSEKLLIMLTDMNILILVYLAVSQVLISDEYVGE